MPPAVLNQLNIVSDDVERTAAFYRRLGIDVPEPFANRAGERYHARHDATSGASLGIDSPSFARLWNRGWAESTGLSGRVVIGFQVATREAVDRAFVDITAAGYRGLQPPYDAFWGSRYAIVEDPNGLAVGIMSPADEKHQVVEPPEP